MERRCSCGHPLERLTDPLGCIECGRACCPACAVPLESVAYCARCASELLGVPAAHVPHRRWRRYEVTTVF
jgi:hypothetical protein